MQYTVIFHGCKNSNFQMKKKIHFFLFLPKNIDHGFGDVCMKVFTFFFVSNDNNKLSRDVRKPDFCKCENKDAVQLRGNREADQRLCFRYTDSSIPLLPKCKISSL